MNIVHTHEVPSLPSTDKGIVEGISDYGSLFIKSIRHDYNHAPEYKCWTSPNACTRLEYKKVNVIDMDDRLTINYRAPVTKIELINLPIGIYTLQVNGFNVMSSKNMIFDIEHVHTSSLDSLIEYGEKMKRERSGPCMCGMCNLQDTYHKPECRCLHLSSFDDVRICYNKHINIPNIIHVNMYYQDTCAPYTIYRHTKLLDLKSPTEYISIILDENTMTEKSQVILKFSDCILADIKSLQSNKLIVKFYRCRVQEKDDPFGGAEDIFLCDGKNDDTINFSRIQNVHLVALDCSIKSVYSAYYMSYYLPSNHSDEFSPIYMP